MRSNLQVFYFEAAADRVYAHQAFAGPKVQLAQRLGHELARFGFAIRAGWTWSYELNGADIAKATAELGVTLGGVIEFEADWNEPGSERTLSFAPRLPGVLAQAASSGSAPMAPAGGIGVRHGAVCYFPLSLHALSSPGGIEVARGARLAARRGR